MHLLQLTLFGFAMLELYIQNKNIPLLSNHFQEICCFSVFLSVPEIAISKCLCILTSSSILLPFKKVMFYNFTPFFLYEDDLYYVSKYFFVMAGFKTLFLLNKLAFLVFF